MHVYSNALATEIWGKMLKKIITVQTVLNYSHYN